MHSREHTAGSKPIGSGVSWLLLIVLGSVLRLTMVSADALPDVLVGMMEPPMVTVPEDPADAVVTPVAGLGHDTESGDPIAVMRTGAASGDGSS